MKKIKILFWGIMQVLLIQSVWADDGYYAFKKSLEEKGFEYGIDVSLLAQRSSPSGKSNAVQFYVYPYFSWELSDNKLGRGTLNFAYSLVRYGNHNGNNLSENSGFLSGLNDYPTNLDNFAEFYYEYKFAGALDPFTIGVGQFPLYNFDGTDYNANQQINFLNDALAQNASATYTQAGVGIYTKINVTENLVLAVGGQDGTNINAESVQFNLSDGKYTTFEYMEYTPVISDIGKFALLIYQQPSVRKQKESTDGWSFNWARNLGEKLNVFARLNQTDGHVAEIKRSFVLGGVYNNPINRNPLDQIGLAYALNFADEKAALNTVYHKEEQVVELYWSWGVGNNIIITPDVQFYIKPAFAEKSDYGLATSLRATILF